MRFAAIDMCTIFKSAIREALPGAILVADHFHLVQLANQSVTEVRRPVTVTERGRRGRKGNREWELRNRLTRHASRMLTEKVDELEGELVALPTRIGPPILAPWNAKEDLARRQRVCSRPWCQDETVGDSLRSKMGKTMARITLALVTVVMPASPSAAVAGDGATETTV